MSELKRLGKIVSERVSYHFASNTEKRWEIPEDIKGGKRWVI